MGRVRRKTRENATALYAAAVACVQAGQRADAARWCGRLLALDSRHAEGLHLLGVLEHEAGRSATAVQWIQRASELRPDEPLYDCNLGIVLVALGRVDEALSAFERAILLKPDYAEAYFYLGHALQVLGRLHNAVASYVKALQLRPAYAVAYLNLGNALQALGRLHEAEQSYTQALLLRPEYAEAHMNLGNVLHAQGKPEEARAHYQQACALRSDYVEAHVNHGNLLQGQGRFDEAVAAYGRALALRPHHAETLVNLGTVFEVQQNDTEAVACYERALAARPDYAEAHINLALNRTRRGDFEQGLPGYEWRRKLGDFQSPVRQFAQPQWCGEPLSGARILLHAEQGLGDSIQCLRYVPLVAAAGGLVIVEVPGSLLRLAAGVPGIANLVAFGEKLPEFAWHCPLMSLPLACGTTMETIPAQTPYLQPPKTTPRTWLPGLRVGLVWAGNERHRNDGRRSIPLRLLQPLLATEGVTFYSLQVGRAAAQLCEMDGRIVDLTPWITDLADTAGLIAELDLVITVDTAVAHLAGALGHRVWILLCTHADWRWMKDRLDSPWYPTARLFRQENSGDWGGVVRSLRAALAGLLAEGSAAGS